MRKANRSVVATLMLGLFLPACGGGDGTSCEEEACPVGQVCENGRCVPSANPDASTADASNIDAPACREIDAEGELGKLPIDIIIAIDQSSSMDDEIEQVQLNINRFVDILGASDLDYRVVLINNPGSTRFVCVPPPLGSGPPDCASGEEGRLRIVPQRVSSRDALEIVINHYGEYSDFLRFPAVKVFLWITDDETNTHTADEFRADLAGLAPAGMFRRQIHNSIVGFYGDTPETWGDDGAGECATLERVGYVFLRLASCLDDAGEPLDDCLLGSRGRVCEEDWTDIFNNIAEGLIAHVPVSCEFPIPNPPDGHVINYSDIMLTYVASDETEIPFEPVARLDACNDRGWYFNDPAEPTEIHLCQDACYRVQGDDGSRIDVTLGCFPIVD